jgi:hypothetical protein
MMDHRIVDVHQGSQSESWLVVYQDGRIEFHFENDGHYCMRHGTQPVDTPIDMEGVRKLDESHGKKNLVQQVQATLAEMAEVLGT